MAIQKAKKEFPADEVLAELPPVGKYRTRILKNAKGNVLDVREYVVAQEAGGFEGFTRKGIRLTKAEAKVLAGVVLAFDKQG